METYIAYFSRTGNNRRIAEAIGKGINVRPVPVDEFADFGQKIDLLFLGGSLYFWSLDKSLSSFIARLDPDKVKNIAIFSTNFGSDDAYRKLKLICENQGIYVVDEHFHALGRLKRKRKDKPLEQELEEAAQFGKDVVSLYTPKPEKAEDIPEGKASMPAEESGKEEADPAERTASRDAFLS